jgi:hypothetical protein
MREQEFFEKMAAVWLEISDIQDSCVAIEKQMAALEQAGMVNATVHTRSDNGGMELLHPTGSDYERQTGRRREYVGKKPEAQQAAQDRVNRYHEYHKLKNEWSKQASRRIEIYRQIERLELAALGKQAKLFSDMGTDQTTAAARIVPIDYNRLTHTQVIDYFRRSPDLAAIADDVQAVLGKVEWTEVQKAA